MKKLIFVCVIIFFTGCITEKKRAEICQSCPVKEIYKDSTDFSIIVKDSVIYVAIPKDSIIIRDSLPCGDMLNISKKIISTNVIHAEAWVKNNILFLQAWTRGALVPVVAEQAVKTKTKYIYRDIIKTLPAKTVFKTPWYIIVLITILSLLVLYLAIKSLFR